LKFSVGIPHYNRGGLIYRPLFNLLNHPAVAEVVIVDDGSRDEEFRKLREFVDSLGCGERVKVFRREENRGALLTKLECVEKCSSDWVLVLDSDNTAFLRYLDSLGNLAAIDSKAFYCANWAFPFFPFHDFSGKSINFKDACKFTQSGLLKKLYLINDGNFLVPKKNYLESIKIIKKYPIQAADVILVNYKWLSDGHWIHVIPRASYYHRVEKSSFWNQNAIKSKSNALQIFDCFSKSQRWNFKTIRKVQ
jgi:glycosyltransferase involved in cell wall biosynthesis